MNAFAAIAENGYVRDREGSRAQINEWRGRMIDGFAHAELAVSKILLAMAKGPESGKKPKLPHLTGPRYADLAKRLDVPNPRSSHTRSALRAIARFQGHDPLRALLCHGAVTVRPSRDSRWVADFRMLASNAGSGHPVTRVIDQAEAERLFEEVTAHRKQLCSVLGQLREPSAVQRGGLQQRR